ncbi:low molecular weight protein arginine phosphatase [Fervidibacillus halotolerans]|uniref:Low molecular weight protein arginine phosphatase n=1 Tax=Fervidibacillus halotolerans TaxID=2980027 RepID=A0A9E8LZ17_9BACI|nr:low molecular weight protein arginine phosphatase [Fervidibacillus halotolerans]WAA12186.1 low molecular weight protein arginine phosphatase [Fervidibacillus halotolerans]
MIKVLFVCTGNTCRSPMAAALLHNKQIEDVEVQSAGIFAMEGLDASPLAKQVLNENDITYNHSSRLLTEKEVEWADIILTMTKSHKDFIVQHFERAKGNTFTLNEFIGEGEKDVVDPFGGNIHTYRETFRELSNLVDKVVEKLAE